MNKHIAEHLIRNLKFKYEDCDFLAEDSLHTCRYCHPAVETFSMISDGKKTSFKQTSKTFQTHLHRTHTNGQQ